MIILEMYLENWCQHEKLHVEFSRGSTGIMGPNGSGKSNLINALKTLLRGYAGKGVDAEINTNAVKAVLKLVFEHEGTTGTVERRFYRVGSNTAKLKWGDMDLTGIKPVNEMLATMMGLTTDAVDKFVFISQEGLRSILFETAGTRLDSLIAMLPEISESRLLRKRVGDFIKTIPLMSLPYDEKTLSDMIDDGHREIAELRAELTAEVLLRQKIVNNGVENPEGYLAAVEQSRKTQETIELLSSAISDMEAKIEVTESYLEQEVKALIDIDSSKDYGTLQKELEVYKNFNFEMKDALTTRYEEIPRDIELIDAELEGCVKSLEVSTESQTTYREQLAATRVDLARYDEQHQGLSCIATDGNACVKCPTCGSELDEAHIAEQRKDLAQQISRVKAVITGLNKALALDTAAVLSAKAEIECKQDERLKLTEELSKIASTLMDIKVPSMSAEEAAEAEKSLALWETRKGQDTTVGGLKQVLADQNAQCKDLSGRLSALQETLADVDYSAEDTVRTQLQATRECDNKISDRSARLTVLGDQLSKNETSMCELQKVKESQQAVDDFRVVSEQVHYFLHRDQLPKALLRFYLDDLRKGLSHYLGLFSSPLSVEIDNDFNMTFIKGDAHPQDISRLSGGEKSIVSVALHLAVSDLFITEIDLLFLDEPSQNMDDEYVSTLTNIIHTLSSESGQLQKQLGVVTHHVDQMKGVFSACILLGRSEEEEVKEVS